MKESIVRCNKPAADMCVLQKAWSLFCTARAMSVTYKKHRPLSSKYVFATSQGHEAVQIALGLHCQPDDYLFPYYRDDALLLAVGLTPKDMMAQLLAKATDPYSMGRNYYAHSPINQAGIPKIPHQSSGTGMQAIPATGAAMGLQYIEKQGLSDDRAPVVVCSLGDGALSEGEVSEALQYAELKQLPILFLIQNNQWSLSAKTTEIRGSNIETFLAGVPGIRYDAVDGNNFTDCYTVLGQSMEYVRNNRAPAVVHADVRLLDDHTSLIPAKRYRDDLCADADILDPFVHLRNELIVADESEGSLDRVYQALISEIEKIFLNLAGQPEPDIETVEDYVFAELETDQSSSVAISIPEKKQFMLEYGLLAMRDLLSKHPECLIFGQDVGGRLGGVFGATASLEQEFGSHRVFNMPIQEALTVGSTVGLSAVGCRPIVEIQFADYLWLGLNQLFSELSRSCYLSAGKWPVSAVIRVAIGAYDVNGPYHSSSIEAILTNIVGIKVVYPSSGPDLYGLLHAAYEDPNPVIVLEHKALYWSKGESFELVNGFLGDCFNSSAGNSDIAIGKAKLIKTASVVHEHSKVCIITWGMGVHLAWQAAKSFADEVEILDLRTLSPLDEAAVFASVRKCRRCLIVTEEAKNHSFAQNLAGRIQASCFADLICGIQVLGALNIPAIPLNEQLEKAALPSVNDVIDAVQQLLNG